MSHTITTAQLIRDYTAPSYLVEPIGGPSDQADLDAINDDGYEVVETTVAGWGPYDRIIVASGGATYLAGIDPNPTPSAELAAALQDITTTHGARAVSRQVADSPALSALIAWDAMTPDHYTEADDPSFVATDGRTVERDSDGVWVVS